MLKLKRNVQQSVIIHPNDDPDNCITVTVFDTAPGSVGLGFEGDGFRVVRSEIWGRDLGDTSKPLDMVSYANKVLKGVIGG